MNKEIERILKGSPVKCKWRNFGTWTKEKHKSLYDVAHHIDIKYRVYYDDYRMVKISVNVGHYKQTITCGWTDFERMTAVMYAQYLVYLGDSSKFECRFRDYQIFN